MNVLDSTKDKLIALIIDHPNGSGSLSELKGAKIRPKILNDTIQTMRGIVYDDPSLTQGHGVWKMNYPIGYTFHTINAKLAVGSIGDMTGSLEAPQLVQALSLNTILTPLFYSSSIDLSQIENVCVLLDATTWKAPARRIDAIIERSTLEASSLTFETVDSRRVPGIQLADIAAYSWRRNLQNADCKQAASVLHDLRFAR